MDPNALEDLFERNADMRLLELRHREEGGAAARELATRVETTFGAESIIPSAATAVDDKALLRFEINAAPRSGVIAGALLGIAIDVWNDGGAPGPESSLFLALPLECEFRAETLRIDGRETNAPERLFRDGLPVPRLPGNTSSKVTFQFKVLPGVAPIILQPRLEAEGVPIVGTVGISIKRGTPGTAAKAPALEPQRPFYELEDNEPDAVGARPELEPILPPVVAAPEPPKPARPAKPKPAKPTAAAPEPEVPPAPVFVDERPTRSRAIGPAELALLDRLFGNDTPGPIAHLLAISTLACTQDVDGTDIGGFDGVVRLNTQLLGRALVLQRLGKTPGVLVTQTMLDHLVPGHIPPPGERSGAPSLRRIVRPADAAAIAAILERPERDPTVRFHVALLGLVAEGIDGLRDHAVASDCALALVSYRANALAWLVPACAASAGQPVFQLPPPSQTLDLAGRRVAAALRTALG